MSLMDLIRIDLRRPPPSAAQIAQEASEAITAAQTARKQHKPSRAAQRTAVLAMAKQLEAEVAAQRSRRSLNLLPLLEWRG